MTFPHTDGKPEGRLVRAAIRYNGKIYTGWRHAKIQQEFGGPAVLLKDPDRDVGFVTENGRYLTRKQAKQYAYLIKQIPMTVARGMCALLSSEDLWDDEGVPRQYSVDLADLVWRPASNPPALHTINFVEIAAPILKQGAEHAREEKEEPDQSLPLR